MPLFRTAVDARLNYLDVAVSTRSDHSAADVWTQPTRTLTQTKFPFWDAIITQTWGEVSIAAGATVYVGIQPPAGETWWVEIGAYLYPRPNYTRSCYYKDYDGTTERMHANFIRADSAASALGFTGAVERILTNSLYARISYYSADATTANYGYSGFKLSKPLWSAKRNLSPAEPWKKETTKTLPTVIEALERYAFDILGLDPEKPDEYVLGIILEEDTPLATDPETGFPVERLTACVQAETLASLIAGFRDGTKDPEETGYRKYLDKWGEEGIDMGV